VPITTTSLQAVYLRGSFKLRGFSTFPQILPASIVLVIRARLTTAPLLFYRPTHGKVILQEEQPGNKKKEECRADCRNEENGSGKQSEAGKEKDPYEGQLHDQVIKALVKAYEGEKDDGDQDDY
jgi:hypothetical protein